MVGRDEGKRKLTVLYLVPTSQEDANGFMLEKGAKSYTLPLALILQRGGVDFQASKIRFTLTAFDYQLGQRGYVLSLEDRAPKQPYTGKPRGRKPKVSQDT